MIKTPELEELCRQLSGHLPNWDLVIDRLEESEIIDLDASLLLSEWKMHYSEVHFDIISKKVDKKNPDLKINFLPIKYGKQTKNYTFNHNEFGRYTAKAREEHLPTYQRTGFCFEYDKIIILNNLPVVFDVKSGEWNKSIRKAMKMDKITRKLMPIRELFGLDAGYVFVPAKDVYQAKEEQAGEGSVYHEFKKNNGLVVPLYATKKEFENDVLDMLREV
jgi:hypothetical protein